MFLEAPIPNSCLGSWELFLILLRWYRTIGQGWKSNITNNMVSSRKKSGFCSKSSRLRCLLIQNSVSVSQSMLSKIPTLSWVQSHVGVIMGRKVQERWVEGAQHNLFTREHDMGGERVRESSVSVFPYLYPPVTTPKTDAFYILTVCRRSFCLFHCVFCLCCFFFTPLLSHQSFPLEAALPLTNSSTLPVGSVWWPTLHSLCMEVQQAYMLCAHKLWCKWLEQKGGAAVRGWKWKCVPL